MKMLLLSVLAFALCLLAGCDYPEAGFFEITASDGGKQLAGFPFMIEELTDDTDLTIGFNILLPRNHELVLVNMKNSMDLSRRGWDVRIGQGDSGYGDLQLTLTHANEQLSFSGYRRDPDAGQSAMFRGTDISEFAGKVVPDEDEDRPAALAFDSPLPTTLLDGRASSARWEIRRISQAQFEKALGMKLADAPRREAPYLSPLHEAPPVETKSQKATVKPGKYKRDKPGGERKAGP